jgi:polysaccharide export outer membrane protein
MTVVLHELLVQMWPRSFMAAASFAGRVDMKSPTLITAALIFLAMTPRGIAQSIAAASAPPAPVDVGNVGKNHTNIGATPDYQIGVDDILAINVWKEPDLSRTVPVRPDGKITLPLVGDLQASGKTTQQLQGEIRDGLASFVAVPEVTVIVQEVRSVKFNIVGQVTKPGSYPLSESMTVLDAIALAGGLNEFAKSNSIYVLRANPAGVPVRLPFHYKDVLKGGRISENVLIRSHDTVVVP